MQTRILILGGYGHTGFLIARLLLQESDIQLVIAGRNLSRAQKASDQLNCEFCTNRVSSQQVDAAHPSNRVSARKKSPNMLVCGNANKHFHHVVWVH